MSESTLLDSVSFPKFPLGHLVATPAGLAFLGEAKVDPLELFARHAVGDWSEMSPEDRFQNQLAVTEGRRVLSGFRIEGGGVSGQVWVITEADRYMTTLLVPGDY